MTSKDHEPTKTLPPKRAAFAREYLRDLNGARAARAAGYAAKSASVEASRLLGNADVQAEITRQRAILAEQADVTPEKIVAELAAIAFADLGDYVRIVNGVPILDMSELPPGASRALAGVDNTLNGVKFKLHDKHAALVSLAKIYGMMQGDGASVTVNIGGADSAELEALTVDELRQLVEARRALTASSEHTPQQLGEGEPGDLAQDEQ